jgi:hypothetical protein
MIVYVAFEFEDVDPKNEQGRMILADIRMSCEHMRVGFDATDCWVSLVTEGNDENAGLPV